MHAARAELAEFELLGMMESVSANGDPIVLDRLAEFGVVAGAPIEFLLVYDTDTPASSTLPDDASYAGAVRYLRARIEDYELRGPAPPPPDVGTAVGNVSLFQRGGRWTFLVDGLFAEDAPDVLGVDPSFAFGISGDDTLFESAALPSALPNPSAPNVMAAAGRFIGLDPVARRFGLVFRILSIQRLGADGPPLRGGEPLLGFRLRSRGVSFVVRSSGCTEKADFVVDVEESGGVHELRLRRIVPDPCLEVVPSGVRIRYSYRELEFRPGDEVRVVNPSASIEVDPRRR